MGAHNVKPPILCNVIPVTPTLATGIEPRAELAGLAECVWQLPLQPNSCGTRVGMVGNQDCAVQTLPLKNRLHWPPMFQGSIRLSQLQWVMVKQQRASRQKYQPHPKLSIEKRGFRESVGGQI